MQFENFKDLVSNYQVVELTNVHDTRYIIEYHGHTYYLRSHKNGSVITAKSHGLHDLMMLLPMVNILMSNNLLHVFVPPNEFIQLYKSFFDSVHVEICATNDLSLIDIDKISSAINRFSLDNKFVDLIFETSDSQYVYLDVSANSIIMYSTIDMYLQDADIIISLICDFLDQLNINIDIYREYYGSTDREYLISNGHLSISAEPDVINSDIIQTYVQKLNVVIPSFKMQTFRVGANLII